MSVIVTGGTVSGSGGSGEDHELLIHRYGIGADGVAWHLDTETYNRVINSQFYRGWFVDEDALKAAHPTDAIGAYAIVLTTGTFWFWEGLAKGWVDTGANISGFAALPPGGVDGQVLTKLGSVDGASEWRDPTGGGGASGMHNDLSGIQGGVTTERFHVTEAGYMKVDQWLRMAPDQPVNISPADGAVDVIERALFMSSDYFHPYGYEMYLFQIRFMNTAGDVVYDSGPIEQGLTTWQPNAGILVVNTQYAWQVRYAGTNHVGNDSVWSQWSEATSFKTEATWSSPVISQPRIIVPGNNTTISTQNPFLVTTPFDLGSGLTQANGDFQVASDTGFTNIIDQGVGMDVYQVATPLTRGGQHFARARHAGDDGTGTITKSAWSPRVNFIVRSFYRSTRIGIVLDDETNWIFRRIGEDWNPIDIDDEYWDYHPVYATLKATQDQLVFGGNAMSTLLRFWIYSDTVPYGPFAGKRVWMIDSNMPTDEELNMGWHVHGAFLSQNYGDQDSLLMSRGNANFTSQPYAKQDDLMGVASTLVGARATVGALNADSSNAATRGWHVTYWYEYRALMIIAQIQSVQFTTCFTRFHTNKEKFYGIYLYNVNLTASADRSVLDGLRASSALVPGFSDTYISISPRSTATSEVLRYADGIYENSDGPTLMHMGDYMLGIERNGTTTPTLPVGERVLLTTVATDMVGIIEPSALYPYTNGWVQGNAAISATNYNYPGRIRISKYT